MLLFHRQLLFVSVGLNHSIKCKNNIKYQIKVAPNFSIFKLLSLFLTKNISEEVLNGELIDTGK